MKTEQEVEELLEASIASYLMSKSMLEFYESKKPSGVADKLARATGLHGYRYRLSDWEEVVITERVEVSRNKMVAFALANVLGEPVHAMWLPEDYLKDHADDLSPMMTEEIKKRALGAEAHMRANRILVNL